MPTTMPQSARVFLAQASIAACAVVFLHGRGRAPAPPRPAVLAFPPLAALAVDAEAGRRPLAVACPAGSAC